MLTTVGGKDDTPVQGVVVWHPHDRSKHLRGVLTAMDTDTILTPAHIDQDVVLFVVWYVPGMVDREPDVGRAKVGEPGVADRLHQESDSSYSLLVS